jgi:predicted hotdog family 3-hydroxylacyl-ACP dehydratase
MMSFPAMTELLPHRGAMLLVECVLVVADSSITVAAVPRADAWYAEDGAMPAWIGIELMAQAVAAYAGYRGLAAGRPPRRGVLLGSRRYQSEVPAFAAGRPLEVSACESYRDESGMGSFDCEIRLDGAVLASATLSVFEPEDFDGFLQEKLQRE